MATIVKYPHKDPLAEIGQTQKVLMSFVHPTGKKDEYQQINSAFICKDYANEMLAVTVHPELEDKIFPLYGLHFKPKEFPMYQGRTLLHIRSSKDNINNFKSNYKLLHDVEKFNKWKRTTILEVDDENLIVVSSKKWQSIVFLISIYLFFIRALTYPISADTFEEFVGKLKAKPGNDGSYAKMFTQTVSFSFVIKNYKKIIGNTTNITGNKKLNVMTQNRYTFHNSGMLKLVGDPGPNDFFYDWVNNLKALKAHG